jgi:hypothetical protein
MAKGRIVYVPPSVFDELGAIRNEDNLDCNADAFKEMAKYSRVGREAKKILRLRF